MVSPADNGAAYHEFTIESEQAGQRLDKAITVLAERAGLSLSRSRIASLIGEGALTGSAGPATNLSYKVGFGQIFRLNLPAPVDPEPKPEDIPLDIVFEDDDLLVVNKPAGMVVHPAPGALTGTLVNALLSHCGATLAGIGGERRPGIVHRIDKDTSGLLVVAKTRAAMMGLSTLFAAHDIDRHYLALVWGAPDRAQPKLSAVRGVGFTPEGEIRVETELARHPQDRKKIAVTTAGGRNAITYLRTLESFGPPEKRFTALVRCRLETGRTHQIRVHAAHIGHSLVGDPVYGRPRALPGSVPASLKQSLTDSSGQLLHAAELGFKHPITGNILQFSAEPPKKMHELLMYLRRNT